MSIKTYCPECQSRFTLDDEFEGKKIRCRKCQAVFGPILREAEPAEVITAAPRASTRSESASGSVSRKEGDSVAIRARDEKRPEEDRPAARRREEDEERSADRKARPMKKPVSSGMPVLWLVSGVLILLLFVGGVVGGLMWMVQKATVISDAPPPPPPPGPGPGVGAAAAGPAFEGKDGEPHEVPAGPFPPRGFPAKNGLVSEYASLPVENPVPNIGTDEKTPAAAKPAKISREARAAVKNGTVYIRVMRLDGGGSGSGFFASADAPNLVVTNAHVVGMLEPEKPEPQSIEVFVHSGQKNEKKYVGKIRGIDRTSDLAVIDIGVKEGLPKPLTIRSATSVQELDEVYVFGFPLGERLGKEITIRDTTVSSLRRHNGLLERIQTKGGMDPGNSGGPVVDTNGHVVGVAVAIIVGREIQFAVPSDRVHGLLYGRVRGYGVGHAVKAGDKITAPFRVETLDPIGLIKQAGVEVWTGNPPAGAERTRPPSTSPPAAKPGDSPRKRAVGPTVRREGEGTQSTGEVGGTLELPALPAGKVYWVQPIWMHPSGDTAWGSASVYAGGQPLLPKAVELRSRFQAGETKRRVLLSVTNRVHSDDNDSGTTATTTTAGFRERVVSASDSGATLALFYQGVAKSTSDEENEPQQDPTMETLRANLNMMKARVQLDAGGNLTLSELAGSPSGASDVFIRNFHNSVKSGLDPTYLPLPGRTVKSGETWKAERTIHLGDGALAGRSAQLNLTCTYLGTRRGQAGREEAVVAINGDVNTGGAPGKAYGQMVVDVASGVIRSVDLNVDMSLPHMSSQKTYSTLAIQLQRDL
jgi:predicted Zn finger-like uncharacterized protein